MQFHTIAAAYYLEPASAASGLAALLQAVGMTGIAPVQSRLSLGFTDPAREVLGGQWGIFRDTWAILDEVEGLACLQLYSSLNRYFDNRYNADLYVDTFATGCERLRPLAALLDAQPHYEIEQWNDQQGNRDWLLAQARRVAAREVDALADERVAVLYLSEPMLALWQATPQRDYRDTMDVAGGRLYFAGTGESRMT